MKYANGNGEITVSRGHAQGKGKSYADGVMTWPTGARAFEADLEANKGKKPPVGPQGGGKPPTPGEPTTPTPVGRGAVPGADPKAQAKKIEQVIKTLERSKNGKALIAFARKKNIKIMVDATPNVYGFYSPTERKVGLNPAGEEGQLVATLAHELRHAWQDDKGYLDRLKRSPEDIIWMTRMVEADAEANSIQICWELKEAGYPQALAAHKKTGYADESMAFERAVAQNPAAAKNGEAMREAFDQWFSRPWRRDAYDKGTTEWLEFVMSIYRRSVKGDFQKIQMARLNRLGETPSGDRNYITHKASQHHALDAECYKGAIAPAIRERLAHVRSFFNFTNGKNPHYRPNRPGRPKKGSPRPKQHIGPEIDPPKANRMEDTRRMVGAARHINTPRRTPSKGYYNVI